VDTQPYFVGPGFLDRDLFDPQHLGAAELMNAY
jgi:hypothetical protein